MFVNELKLSNYRCFDQKKVEIKNGLNIIFGPNASGKTTILESICSLGLTKSYRCNDQKEIIKHDTKYFLVEGQVTSEQKNDKISLYCDENGRKIKLNNYVYNRFSEYLGFLNVVVFSASDFLILQGSPKERRTIFDVILCQISKDYLNSINYYKKLLKDRNALLKRLFYENRSDLRELNTVISKQMADYGRKIVQYREAFLRKIIGIANKIHQNISQNVETIDVKYVKSFSFNGFDADLISRLDEDIKKGHTTYGPHVDDYLFTINNQDASKFASQGQQRNILLSIKLAMAEIIYEVKHQQPIVLLDDVFSELDKSRQNMLIKSLNPEFQTIITAASLSDIDSDVLACANLIEITK